MKTALHCMKIRKNTGCKANFINSCALLRKTAAVIRVNMKIIGDRFNFFNSNNEKLTYKVIRKRVKVIADLIKAPTDLLPTYGHSRDMAYPHIEIDKQNRLHYVIVERGQEYRRDTTIELDELLYWIYESVTFRMATSF